MKPSLKMKLVFCVTLSLILCNFNVDSGAIGVNLSSSVARFFGRDLNWNIGNKTKFTDLNVDCLYLIFEHLDFDDLLNVAQMNRPFSTLASAVFRSKYSHLQITIDDTFLKSKNLLNVAGVSIHADTIVRIFQRIGILEKEQHNTTTSFASDTYILLKDYEVIQNTFKHFGHVIKKLKWESYLNVQYAPIELGNLIGKYSSESIVDIDFEECPTKALECIKKPLINVENVTFTNSFHGVTSKTLPINELFPRLRRLNLDFSAAKSTNYFDCHMPHLEHVFIGEIKFYSENDAATDVSSFELMIKKNPQIRSINLYESHPEFLHKISIFLPQLEQLTLRHFKQDNVSIEFANVTTFIVDYGYNSSLENLHFPRLQTLHIYIDWFPLFNEWVNFLNEHKQLSQLQLKHCDLDDSQFKQLTANLTNLVEMTLWSKNNEYEVYTTLSTDCIVEFVKSHEQLKKLNIINYPEQCEGELQKQLEEEWNMQIVDRGLSFERKVLNEIVDK